MAITLDNIAKALMKWCQEESPNLKNYWSMEGGWEQTAIEQFKTFLRKEYKNNEIEAFRDVYKTAGKTDWVFNVNAKQPSEKIVAELACESFENKDWFDRAVEKEIRKLNPENLKEEYRLAKRCIVSIYFNTKFREQLHNKEFIEIFNNYEVGCAMKRL